MYRHWIGERGELKTLNVKSGLSSLSGGAVLLRNCSLVNSIRGWNFRRIASSSSAWCRKRMKEDNNSQANRWRIPKACQECRKRKIRCNGLEPCETCTNRRTSCVYRDVTRQRKRKRDLEDHSGILEDSQASPGNNDEPSPGYDGQLAQDSVPPAERQKKLPNMGKGITTATATAPGMNTVYSSVSATTESTANSCTVQLYYGPTSHFALLQHVYKLLVSKNPGNGSNTNNAPQSSEEVEAANEGLDWSNFHQLFFGTPASDSELNSSNTMMLSSPFFASFRDQPMFLPRDLAESFMSAFLDGMYVFIPFRTPQQFWKLLDLMYKTPHVQAHHPNDLSSYHHLLLALALGARGRNDYRWSDILIERAKISSIALDEVVNLQTVQTALMMISLPHFLVILQLTVPRS